jgi:hypothetical protein
VAVQVRDAKGRPVADAVVELTPGAGAHGPIRFPWAYRVEQKAMQFQPFVLIVPNGAEVAFPNRDAVRHHVYSFSPAKRFELKLYGKDQTRSVQFDKAGVVAIGCNIHDSMVAFIKVVDTPFAAKTDASGNAVIRGAPNGRAKLSVWHPYGRPPAGVVRTLAVAPGAHRQDFTLDVRPPPRRGHGY